MITIATNDEFLDAITTFYAHIFRHIDGTGKALDNERLRVEALDVLKKTFNQKKGYNEALTEAKEGTRGGLRYILDMMTEYLKEEAKGKHILKTLKENIDPLDFSTKAILIAGIMERLEGHLPEEITSQPPEKYVADYEEIIKAYVHSKTGLESRVPRT